MCVAEKAYSFGCGIWLADETFLTGLPKVVLVGVGAVQKQCWSPIHVVVDRGRGGIAAYECFLGDVRARYGLVVDQAIVALGVMHDRHIAPFDEPGVDPRFVLHNLPG